MSSTAIEESSASTQKTAPGRLKALVFLPSIDYYRVFESLLLALLAAGHQVLVALDSDKGSPPPDQGHPFDALREQHPGFDHRLLSPRKDLWLIPASAIRRRLDYLRYLEPEYADQAEPPGPPPTWGMRALLFLPPFRWPFGRRMLVGFLGRLEAAMPIPRSVRSFVEEEAPDVVVVSPLVEFGSAQCDYIRTAEVARVPSVVVIESGDDLTTKGGIRDVATLTVVGTETEAEEAVGLHGLPRERVAVVGAETSNGSHAAGAAGAIEAIESAAPTEVVRRSEGRILRPILWLLTPLLAILLPFMRPIATARAAAKAVRRLPGRIRKRAKTRRRERDEAARQKKLGLAEATNEKKQARAAEKGQSKSTTEAARQQKLARAEAKQGGEGADAERSPGRLRRRTETMMRKRGEKRKADAAAAKQKRRARVEAAKQEKLARAQAKGQAGTAPAAGQEEPASEAAKPGDEALSDTGKAGGQAADAAPTEERTRG